MNKRKTKIDIVQIKKFLMNHKVSAVIIFAGILLACISIYVSYAYFQVSEKESIIGGRVGKIADLEVRIMAQNRDSNGNAIDGYSLYPYIPKAGYEYNASKSYCTNGSTINYANYQATITAAKNDLCYLYFDSIASLDIILNVFAEDVDSNGVGTGNYTKLETTALPSVGYVFNSEKSSCANGSQISYSADDNLFTVEASGKDTCNAYMDALDVDIALKLYIQAKKGSSTYYEATAIPTNNYYEINTEKSSCSGSSTLSMENQKVVISATSKTSCEAYLDITNGPIIQSASLDAGKLRMAPSNIGSSPETYYYSTDGGKTYESTNEDTVQVANDSEEVSIYAVDKAGKTSSIITTKDYTFNGIYPYQSSVKEVKIEKNGYYLLETWGAQGGSYNETYALGGKGGYSKGIIYLTTEDTLYIHTGGKGAYYATTTAGSVGSGGINGGGNAGYRGGTGGGATDIRINQDDLYARVIVAGGGGGAYAYDKTYNADGGAGGGTAGLSGSYYSSNYASYAGGGATATSGGKGGLSTSLEFNGEAGSFGIGGSTNAKFDHTDFYSAGAGGGGFYGGGAAGNYNGSSRSSAAGGGGGSGYVYSESTYQSYPEGCLLEEKYYMTEIRSLSGALAFLSPEGVSEEGHSGDGYAKVTFLGIALE